MPPAPAAREAVWTREGVRPGAWAPHFLWASVASSLDEEVGINHQGVRSLPL